MTYTPGTEVTFTNGRTANHELVTNSGTVHYAADGRMTPYHVLACNGRSMHGAGAAFGQTTTGVTCKSCLRLEVLSVVEPADEADDHGPGCDGPLNCTCPSSTPAPATPARFYRVKVGEVRRHAPSLRGAKRVLGALFGNTANGTRGTIETDAGELVLTGQADTLGWFEVDATAPTTIAEFAFALEAAAGAELGRLFA